MGWFLLTPRFTPFYLANGSRWIQHKVVESIEQVNFGGTVMPQLLLVGDGVEQGSSYHPKKGMVNEWGGRGGCTLYCSCH